MRMFYKLRKFVLVLTILLLWEAVSRRYNPLFVPSPRQVFSDLVCLVRNGELLIAARYSFLRVTVAAILSGVIAFPAALLIYNSRIAKEILAPVVGVMRYIPVTAFYPLLIMWAGIGEEMKIAFLFIATFVYMMPSVVLCLGEINTDLIDTALTIGMSKWQTIYMVQIPAILPSVANSFIMMYGIGFTYIAVAETVNAKYGLGWIIQQSSSRGRTDMVFMAILVIVAISITFDWAAKATVKKAFRWRYLDDRAI